MFSSPFNRMMSAFRGLGRSDYHTRPEVDEKVRKTKKCSDEGETRERCS